MMMFSMHSKYSLVRLLLVAMGCGLSAAAQADEAKPDDKATPKVTFEEHVQAIFRQHCFSCHGPNEAKSLDARLNKWDLGEMVLVPAGEFWMGSDAPEGFPDERPRHRVHLDTL